MVATLGEHELQLVGGAQPHLQRSRETVLEEHALLELVQLFIGYAPTHPSDVGLRKMGLRRRRVFDEGFVVREKQKSRGIPIETTDGVPLKAAQLDRERVVQYFEHRSTFVTIVFRGDRSDGLVELKDP